MLAPVTKDHDGDTIVRICSIGLSLEYCIEKQTNDLPPGIEITLAEELCPKDFVGANVIAAADVLGHDIACRSV